MAHLLFFQNTSNPSTTNCDSNPTHPYPGTKSRILLLQVTQIYRKKSQPSIYLFIFNNLFNNKSNDFNLLNYGEPLDAAKEFWRPASVATNEDWRMSCEGEAEYFCKDFDWEEVRSEVEANPRFRYHFEPASSASSYSTQSQSQSPSSDSDVQAWKQFHTRHASGKFFKERRYLLKEFPELVSSPPNSNPKLLEVGCGNGSTALPILRANKDVIVYACDCSNETLEKAKEIIGATADASFSHRFHTFCCDFSTNEFPNWLACNPCQDKFLQKQPYSLSDTKEDNGLCLTNSYSLEEFDCCVGGVDFVTLIFTLSAVPLERMPRSIKECFTVLKPGGMVLFRDYGLYDMTMLRFEPDKRVGFREYLRSDGTRSYFFCLDTVRDLFLGAGFIELELDYCCVKSVNRRKGKSMRRVWVHGKFQKPALSCQ